MSLLGLDVPPDTFQGTDLSDLLIGGIADDGRDFAVSTYNGQQFGLFCERMICDGRYKYVWNLTDIDELYDLTEDPYELKNIIYDVSRSGVLKDLREKLYGELKRCGDPIIGWTKNQLLSGRKL